LRQCIQSAVLLCQEEYLDEPLLRTLGGSAGMLSAPLLTLDMLERNHIVHVLEHTDGNVTETAKILGIARSTLYDKLRHHAIER